MKFSYVILGLFIACNSQAQIDLVPINESSKPVDFEMVLITAPWCKWCHRMKDEVMKECRPSELKQDWSFFELNSETQESITFHNKSYLPNADEGHTLVTSLMGGKKLELPYVIILNSAQEVIFEHAGFMDIDAFEKVLTSIEDAPSSTK